MIEAEMQAVEDTFFAEKPERPKMNIGDTVDVHVRIKEGDRERVQIFNGTLMRHRGRGPSETFTVRRIVNEEGVERTFPMWCPSIAKIEVKRRGKVRRAKLYYLRERKGRATKVKELRVGRSHETSATGKKK